MQQGPSVTPDLVWDAVTGFQRSAAIKAAIDLEIFTHIGAGAKTATAIAEAAGASERGVRILCDTLTVLGFLSKSGNEYSLTDVSATFLDKKSQAYLGSVTDFLMSPQQKAGFENLTESVKHGGAVENGNASISPESAMWVTFARSMMPMVFPAAQRIPENIGFPQDRKLKVLDIAAGHGLFGIMVAKQYPNAEVYAVDWANVLTVATENAKHFGVAGRHHLIPGSAFEADFGDGYDVVLLTNFLHHFDEATNIELLKRINDAMTPDGELLTLEFVPNDDRISPPFEALFPLVMLAATPSGDAYTFAELKRMFEAAGFSHNEHIPLAPTPMHLLVSTK
jgi:ubiquinone/menaquinone biosynthesis C-methylase UbiE